mmetsp:Transcript_19167/g.64571  ORF Transcript_19167/g.64571 Transcript_19167/m.64571 type:complete len:232 (-) Transcript_19167:387-1082(-)
MKVRSRAKKVFGSTFATPRFGTVLLALNSHCRTAGHGCAALTARVAVAVCARVERRLPAIAAGACSSGLISSATAPSGTASSLAEHEMPFGRERGAVCSTPSSASESVSRVPLPPPPSEDSVVSVGSQTSLVPLRLRLRDWPTGDWPSAAWRHCADLQERKARGRLERKGAGKGLPPLRRPLGHKRWRRLLRGGPWRGVESEGGLQARLVEPCRQRAHLGAVQRGAAGQVL